MVAAAANSPVAWVFFFGGPLVSGVVCGIILARRIGKTPRTKVALAVPLCLVFILGGFVMSFFGCVVGAQK